MAPNGGTGAGKRFFKVLHNVLRTFSFIQCCTDLSIFLPLVDTCGLKHLCHVSQSQEKLQRAGTPTILIPSHLRKRYRKKQEDVNQLTKVLFFLKSQWLAFQLAKPLVCTPSEGCIWKSRSSVPLREIHIYNRKVFNNARRDWTCRITTTKKNEAVTILVNSLDHLTSLQDNL